MDGTYGDVYRGRNASPMTPGTPTTYQTNMNRTKTRKWVEAKVQNYDGDDWGNDYDDDGEPEEPPPAPKPTSLRQTGQVATESTPVTSPYGQPPTPQTAGARASSQTTPNPSHRRDISSGLKTPSSAPPLHVQTQGHHINTPNEQSYGSGSGDTSGLSSPITNPSNRFAAGQSSPRQSSLAHQNPPTATYSSRPEQTGHVTSPTTQTRGWASTTPTSSRFPPRKSSMNSLRQQDKSDIADVSRPGSGSRPGSSSGSARPWMEQRSNSPGQAAGTSTKPLPFIRPADIYRRMEEDKQRASMDSSRPSLDSNDGGGMRSPTGERRRPSFEKDDPIPDTSRGLKTALAPVAERKSEYGMDHLLSNSNNDTADMSRTQNPTHGAQESFMADKQSRMDRLELQTARRGSVSPQLPDLTRLSGFGEDFFLGGSTPTAAIEGQPQYFLENPDPITGPRGPSIVETAASDQPHGASSLIEGPALAVSRDNKDSAMHPASTLPTGADSTNLGVTPNQMASQASKTQRPSIPGGWVSESTNVWSEAATPMENHELQTRNFPPPQEEVSPATESGTEDMVPTTTVKQAQPLDTTPKMVARNDGFGGALGKHDENVANEVASTGPPPLSLPPLQTSDHPMTTSSKPTSTTSRPEASPSSFVPTAPLNTRRGEGPEEDFVATMPARNLTMSSIETTSPNENDRLREDIMKSLNASPVHPASAGALLGPGSNSLDKAASTRESTYLSGVYDDYLGPAEDKSLQETGQALKDASKHNQSVAQPPSRVDPEPISISVPAHPRQTQTKPAEAPTVKRRFSWEASPEEVTLSPNTEIHNALAGADPSPEPAKSSPTSSQSGPTAPTPAVHIDPDNGGIMSHQVSLVSSHGPDGLGIAGLEPPSPVSIHSNRKSLTSPGPDHSKRLSLADEKSLMEMSSQPPSPPQVEHPALSQGPVEESMADTAAPQVASASSSTHQPKIMTWMEILSLPTLPMRAEKFEEARIQYSQMESGLSNWLQHMQSQADGANATGAETDLPQAGQGPRPASADAPGQQPYYQQYLNASNPNLATAPPPGATGVSPGNLMHGQPSSSGLGAGHNQVGVKSKELLHAAAGFGNKATKSGIKSGMKLFNKGKSKLRGSGDKVFQ